MAQYLAATDYTMAKLLAKIDLALKYQTEVMLQYNLS